MSVSVFVCFFQQHTRKTQVRQNIGICPQHDALMPLLTAREHMEMYMDIKGMRQDLKGYAMPSTQEHAMIETL